MGLTAGVALLAVQVSLLQAPLPGIQWPAGARGETAAWSAQPSLPTPKQLARMPWTLRIGPQRPDLVRYNRVEALSLGVRGQIRPSRPLGALPIIRTIRYGLSDKHLHGRLVVGHETLDLRLVDSGYQELNAIEERVRHDVFATSLIALLLGQDDGN